MTDLLNREWCKLVPELLVTDIQVSLKFWTDVLGFNILFDRLEKNFVYLEYQSAEIMLDQRNGYWETGPMDVPFGRGVNFQFETDEIEALKERLAANGTPLYEEREPTYDIGNTNYTCREILLQDPDGYLLRFSELISKKEKS